MRKNESIVVDTSRLTSGQERLVPLGVLEKSYNEVNEPS